MRIEDFPKSIKIQDDSLTSCLTSIKESVKKFWDNYTLLQHYTKHDLSHSERIIEIVGNLLNGNPTLLNDYERFVFLAAVYLHDIGMQSPIDAGLPKKAEYTMEELEIVRDKHNESSAKMIRRSVSQNPDFSLGLERCTEYAEFIAILSRYHRKLNIAEVKDTSFAGKNMRLSLLVALLRLADALDIDFRRVNMTILKLRGIPIKSKFYWFAHHFVQSLSIQGGRIKLYFRFPKGCDKEIIEVFTNKVKEPIKRQYQNVYRILYDNSIKPYPDIDTEVNYVSKNVVESIPDDLLEFINKTILETKHRSQELRIRTGAVWFADGVPYSDNLKVVKCLTNVFKFVEESRNLEAVKEIEKCCVLTMTPNERMIFSLNAGICYYILGKLSEAERYYEDALKISERKDLQEIYTEDTILTKAAILGNIGIIYSARGELDNALKHHQEALKIDREIGYKQGEASDLGNIGLIYSDRGELDNALKYYQEALKIFNIAAPQLIVQTLNNLATIYFKKGCHEQGFEFLARAASSSLSPEQFNTAFSALLRTVRNIIAHDNWENLKSINSMYSSQIIADENFVKFIKAIHEYALYKVTSNESHKRNYEEIKQKLVPSLCEILNELIEGKR